MESRQKRRWREARTRSFAGTSDFRAAADGAAAGAGAAAAGTLQVASGQRKRFRSAVHHASAGPDGGSQYSSLPKSKQSPSSPPTPRGVDGQHLQAAEAPM